MADIYDGAFRTIINDCSSLIIPLINEIFDEDYRGDEQVEFKPNEHFISWMQRMPNGLQIRILRLREKRK